MLLIWLSNNEDGNCTNHSIKDNYVNSIINNMKIFSNADEFLNYVTEIENGRIIVLISGLLAEMILPHIHDMSEIDSIYIEDRRRQTSRQLFGKWPKVKDICKDVSYFCDVIEKFTSGLEERSIHYSFMSTTENSRGVQLKNINPMFMFTRILKHILVTTDFDRNNAKEFINYCRERYADNEKELKNINEFERRFSYESLLCCYTNGTFMYRMIKHALYSLDMLLILKSAFFIGGIQRHIEKLYKEKNRRYQSDGTSIIIYSGQCVLKENFDKMQKYIGGLMAFNSFLAASRNYQLSLTLARSAPSDEAFIGILFVITIDSSKSKIPFASIEKYSNTEDDEDDLVLFSMDAIFRITDLTAICQTETLYQVDLMLVPDTDEDYRLLTDAIEQASFPKEEGWIRFALVLLELGLEKGAEHIYDILLEQTKGERDRAELYHKIGSIKTSQKQYEKAISYFEKCLNISKKILPEVHSDLGRIYNNMGITYSQINDYSKALQNYERAYEIYTKTLPSKHPDLTSCFSMINECYKALGIKKQLQTFPISESNLAHLCKQTTKTIQNESSLNHINQEQPKQNPKLMINKEIKARTLLIRDDDYSESDDELDSEDDDHFTSDVDMDDNDVFKSIFDSVLNPNGLDDIIDNITVARTQLALNEPFNLIHSAMETSTHFGDNIRAYLIATPIFSNTINISPYTLSVNQPNNLSIMSDKIYVGNIVNTNDKKELEAFFVNLGYGVAKIDMKSTNVRPSKYAFVYFNSENIAFEVLHSYEVSADRFIFKGVKLKIGRPNEKSKVLKLNMEQAKLNIEQQLTINIRSINYGTLLKPSAMKNIQHNNADSDKRCLGFISQSLTPDDVPITIRLSIDENKRKLAFILSACSDGFDIWSELKFEWNFHDLKGNRIRPVWVNNSSVYIIIELKRAPIITMTSYSISDEDIFDEDSSRPIETRQPGNLLIAHADAWLFPLSIDDMKLVKQFFMCLRKNNLSPSSFTEDNINFLIDSPMNARRNLEHIHVLSHEEWMMKNDYLVNHFLEYRWLRYPFSTKFEIMKLISKHIITVHDIIVDEQLDRILSTCSMNVLIACTEKTIEMHEHWCKISNNNDDNDTSENTGTYESIPIQPHADRPGALPNNSIHESNEEDIAFVASLLTTNECHLGLFSRFLLLSLNEMIHKKQLCRTSTKNVFYTKHELRTKNADSFLMRKVYVTPSTVFYEGPYREEKCFVTRQYEKYQDQFLRLSFRDEDYRKLQKITDNMKKIYDRIYRILCNGINICDRHYRFLAFSSSQLRDHSCWMFASANNDISPDKIRQSLGKFDDIRPVAKMAARLGQSFSITTKGLELENKQVVEIKDVIKNGHNFTDGIGIIAPWLAVKLAEQAKLDPNASCPCAFQIRVSGCKGMVCLDVARKIKSPDVGILIRESMNKFQSNNLSIDIVRMSTNPSSSTLNRQIILLLSSLGIRDKTFLSMQEKMLKQIENLTGDEDTACNALHELNATGGNGWNKFTIDYLRRFEGKQEPLIKSILSTHQAFLVKELRTKSKILVKQSWYLLGVIDETETLQFGQVFIQIGKSDDQLNSKQILRGPVVVTRNPCFHPGDIRRLVAVDIPALHNLVNVIVFPMNGHRPHPAEMSGGDLDGDVFWVTTDPQLIFERNEEPFDYRDQAFDAEKQAELSRTEKITIDDVCSFFTQYMENDNLGIIANSHMALADKSPGGSRSDKCLQLARLHSIAVDFAKSGVSVPRLTSDLRPVDYPHYMEKVDRPSYRSTTVLGQLYDHVEKYKIDSENDLQKCIQETSSFPYTKLIMDGHYQYIREARITKDAYDQELWRIMHQYGIHSEAEILTGYVIRFTSQQYIKDAKLFDLKLEINRSVRNLREKYIRLFWEEFYQTPQNETNGMSTWSDISKRLTWQNQYDVFEFYGDNRKQMNVLKKASAWFLATYSSWLKLIRSNNNKQSIYYPKLLSFAWLVYPVLFKIYDEQKDIVVSSKKNTKTKAKTKKLKS